MIVSLHVTHFSDPGCPWAWSASPAIAALKWRYGDQLELAQRHDRPDRDRHRLRAARLHARRPGARVPQLPRARDAVRHRAARARPRHVADVPRRRRHPPARPRARVRRLPRAAVRAVHEHRLPRGRRRTCARRSRGCPASTPTRSSRPRTTPETEALFEQDRDEARTAAGGPTEFQGKSANTDGRVRFTAPSMRFTQRQGVTLEAGGFQSFEAYDVLIANLDHDARAPRARRGRRRGPAGVPGRPDDRRGRADHDRRTSTRPTSTQAEDALIAAIGEDGAARLPFGHDALWVPERARRARPGRLRTAGGAPREAAPPSHYGVVVDSVKVSVLLYVPVRNASLDLTGCLKLT